VSVQLCEDISLYEWGKLRSYLSDFHDLFTSPYYLATYIRDGHINPAASFPSFVTRGRIREGS
jgi:hypothetical protein